MSKKLTFCLLVPVLLGFLAAPRGASAQTLLSQGKTATASSLENAGTPASAAVDGNTGTRWSSAFSDPQWIAVDLGATATISKVVLSWEAAYGKAYQIQTSSDASAWTTIYSTTAGAGGTETLNVSGSGRYVRMYGTARGTGYGYSLWELQVYGTIGTPPVLLSQGQPATSSSVEGTLVPANAVDGNTGTRWGSAFADPQWLQVDLGSTATISQVVLNWEAAYGKAYQIQTSNDASAWTTLYSTTTGAGGVETLNVSGSGRYVRLYGTARGTAYGYSLWELQVYGTRAAPTCSTLPGAPTGLSAAGVTSTGLTLSWSAPSAGAGCTLTGYQVYRGGTLIASVTGTTAALTGLAANTAYSFTVAAVNGYGVGPQSAALPVTTPGGTDIVIGTQPASQTAVIGRTATFSVAASGGSTLSYQWQRNGVAIQGATGSSYVTPPTTASDGGASFAVVVSDASGSVSSPGATLTVNASPAYTVYPGFIGTDLVNNTRGAWRDDQIYVLVLGANPGTGALSWVSAGGVITPCSLADNTATNALHGPDGKTYPNYAFTLAQASGFLKLPPLNGGRIYVSLGSPMYIPIMAGNPLGYAGPNPLNPTDPNVNVHYDWVELNWGSAKDAIFINTTQVDMFGLPLTLDVWGSGGTFHQQTGITESIAQIDQEFAAETPGIFQTSPVSPLRIWAPAHTTFAAGQPNGNYFDAYVSAVWSMYASTPLTVNLYNNSRQFVGKTSGSTFTFTEVNLGNGAYGGTQSYVINKPTTQDILLCAGTMAMGDAITSALEAQFCAAFNRHVMDRPTAWTTPAYYYAADPANHFAAFWHAHSISGLAYGFAFDDVNDQSSSIVGAVPEHMAFGIGW
jgi:hypothetical protein